MTGLHTNHSGDERTAEIGGDAVQGVKRSDFSFQGFIVRCWLLPAARCSLLAAPYPVASSIIPCKIT